MTVSGIIIIAAYCVQIILENIMYLLVTSKFFLRIGLALPWSTSLKCNVWFSILETGSVHLSVAVII